MRRPLAALAASLLVLAACGDDAGSSDPIALDGAPEGTDAVTDGTDAGAEDGTEPAPDRPEVTGPLGGVVDASVAEPGTWQVGDAGTVTFSLVDAQLTLDDVSPADGWQVVEASADGDDLDVELERGDERYGFEVELEDDGTVLEVRIDHDLPDAAPGTFELGAAGSVTVSVDGDRLVLDDVTVADGWEVVTESRDDDEVELELARGDERWELEIELDDGRLEVERDHRVRGPV